LIGVSSIVLEVAVGLILGPAGLKLIPTELSVCYEDQTRNCERRADQVFMAHKGTEFCDLAAYIKADRYSPGANWTQGFFGAVNQVTLDSTTHCLNPNDAKCKSRRLEDENANDAVALTVSERRLSSDATGKTKFDTYGECLKSSCELDLALRCATTPDIFTLVGHTGVAMMIFESGMHFDFEQAKTVGPWACCVAVTGTLLPLAAGCGLAIGFGFPFFPDGMSAGISLAPTSVGIALKLLHEAHALQTYFGQAVMTAAFVDDVLSLILFSVLFSLGDDMTFMTFLPLILGIVFMIVAVVACVLVWPALMKWLFGMIPETKPGAKVTRHDEVMWLLMFTTLCIYAQITHVCGTHLWGCFIAGMCFSTQRHAHHVWVKQVKRVTCWWLRIFFACTLAWSIPVEELFSIEAFWKGTLMGIGPCILTKVCCAPFMGGSRWVIGWAMVGRAEFAYFIAIMAKALKMMEDKLFAILIWALIYATIFAPLIFRKVLARYMIAQQLYAEGEAEQIAQAQSKGGRMSAHLPDFEQEEELQHAEEEKKRLAKIEADVQEKEKELRQLGEKLRSAKVSISGLQEEVQFAHKETELLRQISDASGEVRYGSKHSKISNGSANGAKLTEISEIPEKRKTGPTVSSI